MSPLELVDDRFDKLAAELRTARPVAPAALRERVLALAPPPPPRRFEPRLRALLPVAGFAAVAAGLAAALVVGVVHGFNQSSAVRAAKAPQGKALVQRGVQRGGQAAAGASKSVGRNPAALQRYSTDRAFSPTAGRLQRYDAFLRVRVASQGELSSRTQDALGLTRRLGGYVVSAHYAAPGKTGTSSLALRIPIQHVQTAIAAFSAYGTLVSQRIVLKDLQQKVDALGIRIRRLRARIAGGEPQPQLDRDKALLKALTSRREGAVRRAQLASVALTMTVAAKQKHAAAPPGRFHRTLDDAGSVLVRELELLLYALLVAGPLLLLGGAAILASRSLRRRADRRLLERTG